VKTACVAVLLLLAIPARGEPALRAIAQRKALKVGMLAGIAPFVATGKDAEEVERRLTGEGPPAVKATDGRAVCGFDVELVAEAARALGVPLEITLVDRFDDLLGGLRDGRYDLVASALTRNLERARVLSFSDPYFASGLQVLVRDPKRFGVIDQLRKKELKVVFLAGSTGAAFAARELKGATLHGVDSDAALDAAMDDPKVDAVVVDYVTARDAEVRGRVKAKLFPVEERRFTTEHFAFATRQGDPDWLQWLDLFLKEEKSSGAFHRLAARYNAWFRTER
jgi:polar amino acid transport system substrate-binding protein